MVSCAVGARRFILLLGKYSGHWIPVLLVLSIYVLGFFGIIWAI